MATLPMWLQWLVSVATILSSVGVIVAFVQLRISSEQFNKQLKLTEQQFRILNQGYINLTFNQQVYNMDADGDLKVADSVNKTDVYLASALVATLENVGNMPIEFDVKHCVVYSQGKEIYRTSEKIMAETINTIYPKATQPYNFGLFQLNGEKGCTLQQIFDMHITYDLLINYHDFNDKLHVKKIDRGMVLSGGQILVKRNEDLI